MRQYAGKGAVILLYGEELLTEETIKLKKLVCKRYCFSRLVQNEMDAQGHSRLSV